MSLVHKNSGLLVDTYLTNEELVGRRSTPEEFRRELFRYRREGLLRLCSALNMLLFGWSPYIDKDLHDRLVGTFCTAALAAVEVARLAGEMRSSMREGPGVSGAPAV